MNIEQLREVITRCASLDPNDDFGMEKCWEEMTIILSDDISATIHFFESVCTDEELYWLGSVFEDVAEKTQSKELIQVLRNRLAKVTPETYCQQNFKTEHMQKWVDYAEYVRCIDSDIAYAEDRIE
ncbi:MAG: hypothetical protein ACI4XP_00355 [Acutalibacteraceae bacterium]